MCKRLIIAIILVLNHILWIFFARVMKCIAEQDENYYKKYVSDLELLGVFCFPLLFFMLSAANFVSRKAIQSGKFDIKQKK